MTKRPLHRILASWTRRLLGDDKGAAAVEFGLVAPFLIAAVLGITEGASLTLNYNAMHTGVSSGAQYVMGGGTDLDTAKAITLASWSGRTNQASVATSKVCRCGTVAGSCSILCADQSVPKAYIIITASQPLADGIINTTLSTTQEIRTR